MTTSAQVPLAIAPALAGSPVRMAPTRRAAFAAESAETVRMGGRKARRTLVLTNANGLHGRPAALVVTRLRDYACSITVENDGCVVDARSILGLLSLAAGPGSRLTFEASGKESEEALREMERLFRQNFAAAYADKERSHDETIF